MEGTSTEETGWRGSPALLLVVAVGGNSSHVESFTVLPTHRQQVRAEYGQPFQTKRFWAGRGPQRHCPQEEEIMCAPDHSDPNLLSPTMPSGTLYSSVIEVLPRDNECQSQKGKQQRRDGKVRECPWRKGPSMLLASDPASYDGTKKTPRA